ncbi:membrane hypothetical protein [uncultured Desulfovibrio sp.]|uniref:Uncharacterized protein n=1 Tax=uncultured Desulfovibrio sp. TaxID=167968 RepID=A0A212KCW4_9BACT|nr:membrane hypothetical protein [uncultured Desulfovibrio sp.]
MLERIFVETLILFNKCIFFVCYGHFYPLNTQFLFINFLDFYPSANYPASYATFAFYNKICIYLKLHRRFFDAFCNFFSGIISILASLCR